MSRWTQTFENQQINQRLKSSLDSLKSVKLGNTPTSEKEEYERTVKVLQLVVGRFSAMDPEVANLNSLSGLGNWATNIQSQVTAFVQNRNFGHLQNVNTYLDEILNIIRPIEIPTSPSDLKALADAGVAYRQKLVEELESFKNRADEFRKQFDAFSNDITNAKLRLNENNEEIQKQKSRLDVAIAEFQKQFSEQQSERNASSLKALAAVTAELKAESDKHSTEWETIISLTKKASDECVAYLEKRKDQVDGIFGAIGAASLAGNFKEIADNESEQANRWRLIAFIFFTAMGAVAVTTFALTFQANPNWETFVFRLGTALLLSVPAFYAANESSKHRDREKVLRKNFLELSTIDAYLVHLPDEKQNEIKGKLSDKFFGVPEVREKIQSVSNKDLLSFIEKIVKDLTRGH